MKNESNLKTNEAGVSLVEKYQKILHEYIVIDQNDKPYIGQNGISIVLADYANELKKKKETGLLDLNYLTGMFPELKTHEIKSFLKFCISQTIRHKECFGDGSIMYPLWKQSLKRKIITSKCLDRASVEYDRACKYPLGTCDDCSNVI